MRLLATALFSVSLAVTMVHADAPIFSGPQVGERLVPFTARGTLGEVAGKEFDLVTTADGKPTLLIFVHEVTRPSVGLTRLIMNYAATRAKDDLVSGVVFLSADPTDTENWMKRASNALPKDVAIGISTDGQEGPGAYGLNRNVALTVLVGKENQVTANFALVQPSIQADAPKIAKEIVEVLGGGKTPTLAELGARGYDEPANSRVNDPKLDSLLRSLIQKTATAEQVQEAIQAIETYVADKPAAQQRIGETARRIIDAGKLDSYGTPPAQAQLKVWAKKYPAKESPPKRTPRGETPPSP
ncbi:MAG: hypothetical protein O3C40_28495 [Planctomycetota bacterium]|nr:hypothetical protein [Planctomycetota bacterium]